VGKAVGVVGRRVGTVVGGEVGTTVGRRVGGLVGAVVGFCWEEEEGGGEYISRGYGLLPLLLLLLLLLLPR